MLNLAFGWFWILLGFVSGAALGMGFHKDAFMGGYDSWRRRMTRLGHIAFFGTGFLNVLVALTGSMLDPETSNTGIWWVVSRAFIAGAIAMPLCCFIAAISKKLKPIFVLPVLCLTLGGLMLSLITARAFLQGAY